MRTNAFRRQIVSMAAAVVVLLIILLLVHYRAPDLLTIILGLSGIAGGLFVIYEVRLTKQIAQAEFIRDLNSSFFMDVEINTLWRKVLLDEPISDNDRHRISALLTFFETVRLLLLRKVLEFDLIDDLFRNRFFLTIGNNGVQEVALIRHAHAFENVHSLTREWREHLRKRGIPAPPGFYSYLEGEARSRGFVIDRLDDGHLHEVLSLQSAVMESMSDRSWLRENSSEMWAECLQEHVVIGARVDGRLVGLGVLYDGGQGPENIRAYFTSDADLLAQSCNLKVVMVSPEHRRTNLARLVIELLTREASTLGKSEIACTIHPKNRASILLFSELGFVKGKSVETPYGRRGTYVLSLRDTAPKRTRSH